MIGLGAMWFLIGAIGKALGSDMALAVGVIVGNLWMIGAFLAEGIERIVFQMKLK